MTFQEFINWLIMVIQQILIFSSGFVFGFILNELITKENKKRK